MATQYVKGLWHEADKYLERLSEEAKPDHKWKETNTANTCSPFKFVQDVCLSLKALKGSNKFKIDVIDVIQKWLENEPFQCELACSVKGKVRRVLKISI